ncbi:MAG TPA: histidine kinase [Actinocatenispora sp.]
MRARPQLAPVLLTVTLVAWFVGRSGFVFSGDYGPSAVGGVRAAVAVASVGGLAALLFVVATWHLSSRVVVGVLAAQAVLAFAPYFVVGGVWGPVAGGLVASLLFAVPRRISWPLSVLAVALDIVLSAAFQEAGVDGLALLGRLVIDVLVGLSLFGVVLLTDLTRRVAAERTAYTALAVAKERLDNAEHLRTVLGTDLSAVVRLSEHGVDDEEAPARLAEIAAHARHAARTARSVADIRREIPQQPAGADTPPKTTISPRLARYFTLATTLGCALLVLVNLAFYVRPGTTGWVLAVLVLVGSAGLQMYHGAPRVGDRVPRWWRWTLPGHLALLMVVVAITGPPFAPMIVLAAGAMLYRYRPAWSAGVLLAVLVELLLVQPPAATLGDRVYLVASLTATLLQVYAYCRLPEVARDLTEAREGLARLAVVRERLRVARDVHDLLGFSVTGIGLKCELIGRLLGADQDGARQEIGELRRLAERGLAEIRAVTADVHELDLAEELRTAASLLDASGIRGEVTADASAVPAGVDALLATVLREAVTNVVRHAAASTCRVTLTVRDDTATLRVVNDGVGSTATAERAGTGLVSLTARLATAGGRLGAEAHDDTFVLTARVPLRPARQRRAARLQPARLGRDPDRVDPVAGVELGDR